MLQIPVQCRVPEVTFPGFLENSDLGAPVISKIDAGGYVAFFWGGKVFIYIIFTFLMLFKYKPKYGRKSAMNLLRLEMT